MDGKTISALRRPLDFALGSQAKLRVLRLLFLHGQQLAAPILVNRSGLAKASVRTALIELVELGFIVAAGSGRSRLYAASATHPFSPLLRELFRAEAQRFSEIIEALRNSGKKVKARGVWLYGSVAREEDTPSSDVDVAMVVAAASRDAAAQKMREILAPIEERLGFRAAIVALDDRDIRRLTGGDDPWWRNVVKESTTLFGLNPTDIIPGRPARKRS